MLEIRPIAPADAEEVSALVTQLGYHRTASEVAEWIARVDPSKQIALVATIHGEVVGWIEVELVHHLQSAPFALIGGLVVKEGVRGLGTGRRLCERAEAWAWELGVETVRVTSRSTRADAHRFYLRDGYRLDKTSLVFEKRREEKRRETRSSGGC
jgi:predicted N-acetyltransferase YhbS